MPFTYCRVENDWDYATESNAVPVAVSGGTLANTAVYNHTLQPAELDHAGGVSAYGTMAQDGNVGSGWRAPTMV